MPDGGFDVGSLLALGAQGKAPQPGAAPAPQASAPPTYRHVPLWNTPEGGVSDVAPEDYARFKAGLPPLPAQAAPAAPPPDKPFDVMGLLAMGAKGAAPAPPEPPANGGIVANMGAGTSEGLAKTLGAPVDLATGALNLIPRGINAIAGTNLPTIQHPFGGSDTFRSAEGLIGADPRDVPATTEAERIARGAGEGAASMLLPWGAARALPAMTGLAGAAQGALGAGGIPSQVAIGAASGAAGQGATDAAPDSLKPLAGMVGSLAGGAVPAMAQAAGTGLYRTAGNMARGFVAPMTASGRQDLAAATLRNAATDPAAAAEALARNAGSPVPGFQPTTYQASEDQGLGNLERATAKNSPDQFRTRSNEQNAAMVNSLAGLSPTNADPGAVGAQFRTMLDALDADNARRESAALAARDAAERAQPAPQADAIAAAQRATGQLGGAAPSGADAQATALQGYGQRFRAAGAAAQAADKARASALWNAVDPDGTLAVWTGPIKQAARDIRARMTPESTPLDADTNRILGVAQTLPEALPFQRLQALRTQITNALPALRQSGAMGAQENVARLSALLDGLHGAMEPAMQERAAAEERAVAAGAMTPESTMRARLNEQVQEFLARRSADARSGDGVGAAIAGTAGPAAVRGGNAGQGAGGRRFGNAAGNQGVSSPELTPNWDAAATERYEAARAATRRNAATYKDAPGVGEMLAPGKFAGEYATPASSVPSIMFAAKGQAERIQSALRAGVNRQDLLDYGAYSLRRAADPENAGILDPAKARRWLASNTEAATVLPELRTMAEPAIQASETLAARQAAAKAARNAAEDQAKQAARDATAKRAADRRAFERSALGRFIGDDDPVKVVGRVLSGDSAQADMRKLATATAGNPAAREGLKRAVVDHMLARVESNAQAGATGTNVLKSDVFQTWLKDRELALRAIFSPAEIDSMRAVAAELRRANLSVQNTKLPGGSNTAQDLAAGEKLTHGKHSMLGQLIGAEIVGSIAHAGAESVIPGSGVIAHAVGFGATIGSLALNAMRQAGFQKVNGLVTEAMLNPALARTLLLRPTRQAGPSVVALLGKQLQALANATASRSMLSNPSRGDQGQ